MIVAAFREPDGLRDALGRLRDAAVAPVETYTPAPLEGSGTGSPLPAVVLAAGLGGAAASFALQAWSSVSAYPLIVGNRPLLAWASFIPTVVENGILVAIAAGFVGFFAANRMPRHHDAVDEAEVMRRASSDRWCLAVRTRDEAVLRRARTVLRGLDTVGLEEVPS